MAMQHTNSMTSEAASTTADTSRPLDVIIVGGGIAGLTAAVALEKGGHNVKVFEKSAFAAEVGAAVSLAPNGSRVLAGLGFSFERARAVPLVHWRTTDAVSLVEMSSVKPPADKYGFPLLSIHRVDFHNELLRLANGSGARERVPRVSSRVTSVDSERGAVTLENGEVHVADLVVAADGLHSTVRQATGIGAEDPGRRALVSFRFLIPRDELVRIPDVKPIYESKADSASVLIDTSAPPEQEQHMVWYSCRGGEIENFNALTSMYDGPILTDSKAAKDELLRHFANLHPTLRNIFNAAQDVKMWPLMYRNPQPTWVKGKVLLIGDAAHPMLPIGGQGANQSIEDGGALEILLHGINPSQLAERIEMFQQVRLKRAARTQLLSSVRSHREAEVADKFQQWLDDPSMTIPQSLGGRIEHDFGFDLDEACKQKLRYAGHR